MSNWCTCPSCDATYNGSDRYGGHCMECHQSFSSDKAGERHRVGPHEPRGLRRCRTVDEMLEMEWRKTEYGWTDYPALTEEEKARLRSRRPPTKTFSTPEGTQLPDHGRTP